jgi:hypothetical protein
MRDRSDAAAVLVTGAYGTGKSSVVEEIAGLLEGRGVRYGAIDLDWLSWFDPGNGDHEAAEPVMRKNVAAVVANYYDAGVRRFALAGAVTSTGALDALRSTLSMPVTVARLVVPIDEIERRLSTAVTSGRADDLRAARAAIAAGRGDDIGDLVVLNDRPIRQVAGQILTALGW